MYKVDDKDVIARYRTTEEAFELNDKIGGLVGPIVSEESRKTLTRKINLVYKLVEKGASTKAAMKAIYSFIDYYNKGMERYIVCAKGCSHCCHVPVHISAVEASYIEVMTGHKADFKAKKMGHFTDKQYCTFHDPVTATCTIHEYRPFACRIFASFDDPKYCADGSNSHAITTNHGKHADVQINRIHALLLEASNNDFNDIRAYFKHIDKY